MKTLVDAVLDDSPEPFCHFNARGETRSISRRELRRSASGVACFLREQHVEASEVVLIILPYSTELLFAYLGAMLVGAIPSFIPTRTSKQDPQLYWRSHDRLFKRIGQGVILTDVATRTAIETNLPDCPLRLLVADERAAARDDFEPVQAAPDAIALLQHSSGTTGLKKGVVLSQRAVIGQVRSLTQALQLRPSDCIVSWLPLYHDMGLIACFMLPLVARIPVVMLDPFEWVVNPRSLFSAIRDHRGTLCWLPNFAFHHLCRTVRSSADLDLASVRAWIDCSEPCRPETFDAFASQFAGAGVRREHLHVCYAMAETVFAVTQTDVTRATDEIEVDFDQLQTRAIVCPPGPESARRRFLSAGRPIDGAEVRIVANDGRSLPEDYVGEIIVAGEWLFSGYYKLPDESARKLHGRWYHTGDLGFLHQGALYVTGRKNDLIIVHGRNYYAHELEFILNTVVGVHPGRAVAVGWFRVEAGTEEVVAIAECDVDDGPQRQQIAQTAKQVLLDQAGLQVYDVYLVSTGWLVKTTSGKISRVENLQKYLAETTTPIAVPA